MRAVRIYVIKANVLFAVLTSLVPNGTGCLACGLTRRLAFSASALFHCIL